MIIFNLKNFAYNLFILVFHSISSDLNFYIPQVQWKKVFFKLYCEIGIFFLLEYNCFTMLC